MDSHVTFGKQDTYICKAIAIMFMVLHHGVTKFYNFKDLSWYLKTAQETNLPLFVVVLGSVGKVCVSLLTILSGYGIYKKYNTCKDDISSTKFVLRYLLKFESTYLPSFLIMFFLKIHSINDFIKVYGSHDVLTSILYCFFDMLNISRFIETGTLLNDWYIKAIIILYILFPLINWLINKTKAFSLALSLLPWTIYVLLTKNYENNDVFMFYLPSFFTGILLAKIKILDLLKNNINTISKLISITFFVFSFVMRIIYALPFDYLLALSIINFQINFLNNSNCINVFLMTLGKYSANIWLFNSYFLNHSTRLSIVIKYPFVVLALLLFSIALEKAKEILRFNKLIKKIELKYLS